MRDSPLRRRALTVGGALLVAAVAASAIPLAAIPVAAQQRGTVDLGAFLSYNAFALASDMRSAPGAGIRAAGYLSPRWAAEFEANWGTARRPNGLADRAFRFLDGRVLFVPARVGRASLLLGAGAGYARTGEAAGRPFGPHAMVAGRIALTAGTALRLDYTRYYMGGSEHGSLKAGASFLLDHDRTHHKGTP